MICRWRWRTSTSRSCRSSPPSGCSRPGEQAPSGIRLGPVVARDRGVDLAPPLEPLLVRRPGERPVVTVASSQDPAGSSETGHGGHRPDRVAPVLEDLVGMDDVEAPTLEPGISKVASAERDVAHTHLDGMCRSGRDGGFGDVYAEDCPRRHRPGQVRGEGARATSDVEEVVTGVQVGKQVGSGVFRRAAAMGAKDGILVTVGVDVLIRRHPADPVTFRRPEISTSRPSASVAGTGSGCQPDDCAGGELNGGVRLLPDIKPRAGSCRLGLPEQVVRGRVDGQVAVAVHDGEGPWRTWRFR